MSEILRVYCDGGILGQNPSKRGGTYAWIQVENDEELIWDYGCVTPDDLGVIAVTNNQTELYAAVMALEAMPEGSQGVLWTDSQVTLHRLVHQRKFANIPKWLIERTKTSTTEKPQPRSLGRIKEGAWIPLSRITRLLCTRSP